MPNFWVDKLTAHLNLITARVFRQSHPIDPFEYAPHDAPDSWQRIPPHTYWGAWQQDFWMHGTYQIPQAWPLDAPLALHLNLGSEVDGFRVHPEALVMVDGVPFTTTDANHMLLMLPDALKDYAPHTLLLDGWTGLGGSLDGNHRPLLYMQPCAIVWVDEPTQTLVTLARTTLMAAKTLDPESAITLRLFDALRQAFRHVDTREPFSQTFYDTVPTALESLRESLAQLGAPYPVTLHAIGHAHIDTAWLWRVAQTRRKASRTFHSVIHLMRLFPEYHFSQSQPQLYEFVRQDQPALFAQIQQAARDGRWEVMGGMWVESDCNITGAESLARQFLIGRRYLREHFGDDSPVLWLPDTFGFPATLPQVALEAEMRYFFTTKLRWNKVNDFPYDSFWWQGLDGTRILSHITPTPTQDWWRTATYNADANARAMIESVERMKQKTVVRRALMAYGWGDGGGGPTRDMLENLSVLGDFPTLARAQQGTAYDFFTALEAESGAALPTWAGELYLETHQGTLTSQAWIKRANRHTERLLHDTEFLCAYAALLDADYAYPREALNAAWRVLLLNQFHDILPGSSIGAVYVDSRAQFESLTRDVTALHAAALAVIRTHIGGDLLVINSSSFTRDDVALWHGHDIAASVLNADGDRIPAQNTTDGALIRVNVPPYSVTPFTLTTDDSVTNPAGGCVAETHRLENPFLRVDLNDKGDIVRVFDKRTHRDVLRPDAVGNQLQIFEDRPIYFDAWDIDPDFEDRMWHAEPAESVEVIESGGLRAVLRIRRRVSHSVVTQDVTLHAHSARLDFVTTIDWRERHMLLKAAFPVSVNPPQASYHIQWGIVQRPAHDNTSWDAAKREVAMHYAADLSDADYGVSLLSDCKYGCDVRDGVMRLTLLKAPGNPDPDADTGTHHFTYSLHPHSGAFTLDEGYALNLPLHVSKSSGTTPTPLPPLVQATHTVIETVKLAEDGAALVIRLYEPYGRAVTERLTFARPIQEARRVNILEEPKTALMHIDGHTLTIDLTPRQFITLMVTLEGQA